MQIHARKVVGIVAAVILAGLMVACTATLSGGSSGNDEQILRTRLIAANLLAGSVTDALNSAVTAGVVSPVSDRALLIVQSLDAAERSLDSAGMALRAGFSELAERQVDAAEMQLGGLQPLLPHALGENQKGVQP